VANYARKHRKPVFAIGGKTEKEASSAFDGIFSLVNGPVSLEHAMKNARELLFGFSVELAKTINTLTFGK
jgi:glycerate kinase